MTLGRGRGNIHSFMDGGRAVGERRRRLIAAAIGALCVYFSLESLLPARHQPSAALGLAAIRGYQALGSPAMAKMGVRCRYTPTCSHYAAASLRHYGTLEGVARTAGRLWRCSPWGGAGYDPAVASLSAGPIQQETPEERRRREEEMKKFQEEAKKASEELRKAWQEAGPEAGKAAGWCAAACLVQIFLSFVLFVAWVVTLIYIVKDAKARGDQNAVLWIILAVFFPLVGVVVYFFARPKGNLQPCANCKNRRLETLVKCPHCGADAAGGAKAS